MYFTNAQESVRVCKNIPCNKIIVLDSNTVYKESIVLAGVLKFFFDQNKNTILVTSNTDSVSVCYLRFPFSLHKTFKTFDAQEYQKSQYFSTKNTTKYAIKAQKFNSEKEELFSFNNFEKSGNFTRGIAVGNNQNSFINSSLNLQLAGNVTENLKLTGAISDQNMPIQPNGYTQNVQSFDRIYLQLEQEKIFKITAGDYVMKNPNGTNYLKYLKNVQGLQTVYNYRIAQKDTASTTLGVSFAKGKFASIQIVGSAIADANAEQTLQEGVLGPYRLTGPNKERFVQVIANSEKVFLDGNELKRGFNNDYTIDYNSGEIRFTPNIIITKYSRIRIDFEYSDRIYARTNYQVSHAHELGKLKWNIDYYKEKDNPRSPLAITLSDENKVQLSLVGDTLEKAFVTGADSVGYSAGAILYRYVKDTLVNGSTYNGIYQYSTNPILANYVLNFSYVGQGNGDYVPALTINNGRVYEWVAPVAGVKQGSYIPLRIVTTPKSKSMITSSLKFALRNNERVYSEIALSTNDLNLYSNIGDADNQGKAIKMGYENTGTKISKKRKIYYLGGIDLELIDSNFVAMDRFRPADFDRDWNASPVSITNNLFTNNIVKAKDQILSSHIGLKDSLTKIKYTNVLRNRPNDVYGHQHKLEFSKIYNRFFIKGNYFTMLNTLKTTKATWNKLILDAGFKFKSYTQGYLYQKEDNRVLFIANDSVVKSAQNFQLYRFYTQTEDTLSKIKLNFYTEHRDDYMPLQGKLLHNSTSRTQNVGIGNNNSKINLIKLVLTYRITENNLVPNSATEHTFNSRFDWNGNWFNKSIKSDLVYTTSTGRELRKEFIYIPVPTGQGTYTWRDDNADGIQQLNEFYDAINFDEKTFIKTYVPTNQYIPVYNNNYNYRLTITPPVSWKNKNSIKKQLSKWSNNTYYTLDKSNLDNSVLARLNPIVGNISDTSLLRVNANFRNTLFWNRQKLKYGAEYTFNSQDVKQFLTNGFDARKTVIHQTNVRKMFGKKITIRINIDLVQKRNTSDFLSNKNYFIKGYLLKPECSFQPNNSFRISIHGAFYTKQNVVGVVGEHSQNKEMGAEIRWAKSSKRTLQVGFKTNNVEYKFATNTPLAYEMLDALKPGQNYYANLNYTQKIMNGLQLTLNYEARKFNGSPLIHLGKIQATALF